MPNFVDQLPDKVRKQPLGPVTLNQMHENLRVVDGLVLREHFANGEHNAPEVPWILGHIGGATTGYMFDTGYGGGSIARPATGRVTLNAAAGVINSLPALWGVDAPAASVIANVSDAAIATFPHIIEAEMISETSVELRTRVMTSTLGSPGNSWSTAAVAVDVAVHAQKQPQDPSLLVPHLLKQRRDFLTEAATDWNAAVVNQATIRKALNLEHQIDGTHLVDRIAKATGWFRPSAGPAYSITVAHRVASVSRISTGVIEVTINDTLEASLNYAACFPQAQPASADELVLIHGRCTAASKFRFYIYVYSVAEGKWDRGDRSFFAAMFGRPA